jgi:hypothetical protein
VKLPGKEYTIKIVTAEKQSEKDERRVIMGQKEEECPRQNLTLNAKSNG